MVWYMLAGMVWYSMVWSWYGMVWYGMGWDGMVSLGESRGLTFQASGGHLGSILRPGEVIGTQFRRPGSQRV